MAERSRKRLSPLRKAALVAAIVLGGAYAVFFLTLMLITIAVF